MSNFSTTDGKDSSGRSQVAKRQAGLVADLAKSLDVQHHNTSIMHAFGEAFEIPPAVTTDTSGKGSVGKAPSPARSDHQHGAEVPTFIYPALLNGWANYGGGWISCRYHKMGGQVFFEGMVTGGTIGAIMCVLDVGYRPGGILMTVCPSVGPSTSGRVDFNPSGNVVPSVGWGNNGWMWISANWYPGA